MSLEGQQLGRYRILRLLGSGGMGEVYLAEDASIERQVAIKVIRAEVNPYPDKEASQDAIRLFQREARAIAKLDHPHILPLYDHGEERMGNLTVIYLVMPYRREGSFSDWLRQRGQAALLAPQEVAHFMSQAASALQHAHDHQIIHQDVKPSNFLLRQRQETPTRPDLLLADFGIARFSTVTARASQSIRGTPTSMAPEQWEGHPVPATDQYALAILAYELLAGRPPFQGAPGPLMYQHLTVAPPPPSSVNPRLSSELDAVLLHALAKRPEQRFASIMTLANAFEQAAQATPTTGAPTRLAATPAPAPHSAGDIRAELAISIAEAQAGTTRTLTLPGGRQVTVTVPANVRDGQIVRLDGQGDVSPTGGPVGALLLSIVVKAAQEPALLPPLNTVEENTVLMASQSAETASATTVINTGQPPSVSNAALGKMATSQRPLLQPAQRGISRRAVVAGLAALAVVGGAGGGVVWLAHSQQPSAPPASTLTPSPSIPLGTLLYTYRGHHNSVLAVAWSPANRSIASGSADQTVQVWNASDGSHIYTYQGHSNPNEPVSAVAWSSDGKRIASVGGYRDTTRQPSSFDTVQVWDATDGGHAFSYRGYSALVFAIAWSPDSRRIASGGDRKVEVWDATNGGHVYIYGGHASYVETVAWSPDGRRIASGGSDQTVQVWDATTGGNVFTYHGHTTAQNDGYVLAVAWSPNGKRIASGGNDNTVQVWDATNGGNVFTYRGHASYVETVAWSPNGKRIASGGHDNTVQVWDAIHGGNVFTYRGHADKVNAVAWSPDGKRIASGSADQTVHVWSAM